MGPYKFIILGVFLFSQAVLAEDNNKSVLLWNNDNNISDFHWSRIVFLENEQLSKQEVSQWKITSHITNFRVWNQEGLCVEHSKKEEWNNEYTDLWLIKKIQGIYYATTFEWLRPLQTCIFNKDLFSLENALFGEESNPIIVGFALALPQNREKSNVLWRNLLF